MCCVVVYGFIGRIMSNLGALVSKPFSMTSFTLGPQLFPTPAEIHALKVLNVTKPAKARALPAPPQSRVTAGDRGTAVARAVQVVDEFTSDHQPGPKKKDGPVDLNKLVAGLPMEKPGFFGESCLEQVPHKYQEYIQGLAEEAQKAGEGRGISLDEYTEMMAQCWLLQWDAFDELAESRGACRAEGVVDREANTSVLILTISGSFIVATTPLSLMGNKRKMSYVRIDLREGGQQKDTFGKFDNDLEVGDRAAISALFGPRSEDNPNQGTSSQILEMYIGGADVLNLAQAMKARFTEIREATMNIAVYVKPEGKG